MAFENTLAPSPLAGGDQTLPHSSSKRFVEVVAQNDYLAHSLQKLGMFACVNMYEERELLAPLTFWRDGGDLKLKKAHNGALHPAGRNNKFSVDGTTLRSRVVVSPDLESKGVASSQPTFSTSSLQMDSPRAEAQSAP